MSYEQWWIELANELGCTVEFLQDHHLPLIYFFEDGATPKNTAKAFLNVRD